MIVGRGLVKAYGERRALAGVDVDVAQGETVAVLGPNGAGKTTLLRMLATLHRPDAGSLTVLGAELPDQADRVRGRIGYLGHDPLVYLDLTAIQNLTLFADLYAIDDAAARVEEMLERVGLIARAFEPVRTFSRGMAQRLGIARMLLHRPELLCLDEPAAGLDARGIALLDEVVADAGTVVLVTHDVDRAMATADRVLVMRGGTIALTGTPAALGAGFRDRYAKEFQ